MKIDKTTIDWIKRELNALKADPEYSPVLPWVDRILDEWRENNPKMYGNLQRVGLSRQMAELFQSRVLRDRDEMLEAGMPPTDAMEQAQINWYLEPEEQEVEESPLVELDRLLYGSRQIPP